VWWDHPEYRAFLAAVRARPAERTVRLVCADWLDGYDGPCGPSARVRAAYIRAEVEAYAAPYRVCPREENRLAGCRGEAVAPWPEPGLARLSEVDVWGGFVTAIVVKPWDFAESSVGFALPRTAAGRVELSGECRPVLVGERDGARVWGWTTPGPEDADTGEVDDLRPFMRDAGVAPGGRRATARELHDWNGAGGRLHRAYYDRYDRGTLPAPVFAALPRGGEVYWRTPGGALNGAWLAAWRAGWGMAGVPAPGKAGRVRAGDIDWATSAAGLDREPRE